jgi:hypothetical protein
VSSSDGARLGGLPSSQYLEEHHTDAGEHSGDYHGGHREWCDTAANDDAERKRSSQHLQDSKNQADDCPSPDMRACGFAASGVSGNPQMRRNHHRWPIRSISFLIANWSRLDKGRQRRRLILRSRIMKASRKERAI